MERDTESGQYSYKGGVTIAGKLFAYQEKTGSSIETILKMPYILFVLGGLDAPSLDTENKENKAQTPEQQMALINNYLL